MIDVEKWKNLEPTCKDWPLWKLPNKRIEKIVRRFKFVATGSEYYSSDDDNEIRPLATRLGVPGMEAFPFPDSTGWGTVVLTSDGEWSYAIAGYAGYDDPRQNGYSMYKFRTEKLMRFLIILGLKEFAFFVESMLWMMGFNGEKSVKSIRLWDFAKGN